jgi:cytochrome b
MSRKAADATSKVFVWELPIRLFHWTLLLLVIGLYVTAELMDDGIELHASLGLALLSLVAFRVIWGFVGGRYARFTQFVRGPRTVLKYTAAEFRGESTTSPGHNPLGGWMVVALLITLLIQVGLGLFSNDDILFDGALARLVSRDTSDLLTGLHVDLFNVLAALIGLHVAAVIGHRLFKGENLVTPMFTGYKQLPAGVAASETGGRILLRASVLLAICGGLVYGFIG